MALPTITNNSPSAGYIKWTAFGIQYNGQAFNIPADQTNKKFVWWKYNGGTSPQLVAGDVLPDLTADDIVLFLNKNGIGTLVPATQVVDGSLVVSGSILADGIGANQIQAYHVIANAITSEKIAANSVTAQHVLAGSITTEKLSVGAVGDNMVANGSFEDGTQGWNAIAGTGGTADIVTGVASSGAYALRIVRGTTNKEVQQLPQFYVPVTANAGTKWYVTCQAGAGVALTSGFYFRVMWYQADKTTAASTASVDVAANVALGTTWKNFEAQVTPPANARYMAIRLINANGTSTMYVDSVAAHEVITSAVIGDGQITTAKMVANTISGDRITTNTMHADKIIANTITAEKLNANAINGMTITGSKIQTNAAQYTGVKFDVDGISAFDTNGNRTFTVTPEGSVSVVGSFSTRSAGTSGSTLIDPYYGVVSYGSTSNSSAQIYNGALFLEETAAAGDGGALTAQFSPQLFQMKSVDNGVTREAAIGFNGMFIQSDVGGVTKGIQIGPSSISSTEDIQFGSQNRKVTVFAKDVELSTHGGNDIKITSGNNITLKADSDSLGTPGNLYINHLATTSSDRVEPLMIDIDGKVSRNNPVIGTFTYNANNLYGPHTAWQPPIIEKIGTRVHFHGTITNRQLISFTANAAYICGTIPVGFRPKAGYQVFQPGASSPGIGAWVGAYTSGTVEFALITAVSAATNSWILGFDLWWETV